MILITTDFVISTCSDGDKSISAGINNHRDLNQSHDPTAANKSTKDSVFIHYYIDELGHEPRVNSSFINHLIDHYLA